MGTAPKPRPYLYPRDADGASTTLATAGGDILKQMDRTGEINNAVVAKKKRKKDRNKEKNTELIDVNIIPNVEASETTAIRDDSGIETISESSKMHAGQLKFDGEKNEL